MKFTHELAYKKGVDLRNCHRNVIRGSGDVPRERCLSCHSRAGDLRASPTTSSCTRSTSPSTGWTASTPHADRALAGAQQARPRPGRLPVLPPESPSRATRNARGAAGRNLLAAQGGGMAVVRVECRTCHRVRNVLADRRGDLAGLGGRCADVPRRQTVKEFAGASQGAARLAAGDPGGRRPRPRRGDSAKLAEKRAGAVAAELEGVQHDLDFLFAGSDVHNMHYAAKLHAALVDRVSALCRELNSRRPEGLPSPAAGKSKITPGRLSPLMKCGRRFFAGPNRLLMHCLQAARRVKVGRGARPRRQRQPERLVRT